MKNVWLPRIVNTTGLSRVALASPSTQLSPQRAAQRRSSIECLEDRIAPATIYVVPVSQALDPTHRHNLADAMSFAGASGTVIIEPGSVHASGVVNVTLSGLTIEGDPNISGGSLPEYSLNVSASGVRLDNLNLGNVTLTNTAGTTTISRSQLFNLTETGAVSGAGHNTLTHNFISGAVDLQGDSGSGQTTGDMVVDNEFAGSAPITLNLTNSNGTTVQGNHFANDATSAIGIMVRSGSDQVTISGNTVEMTGLGTPTALALSNTGGVAGNILGAKVLNNNLQAGIAGGTGLFINVFGTGAFLTVQVEGNDFTGSKLGVDINGITASATGAGNVDLGGGANAFGTSKGANHFRGYDGVAGHYAIVSRNTDAGITTQAQKNIFEVGVDANTVVKDGDTGGGTGAVNVANALDANHAYVQNLFHDLLGRVGDPATEIEPLVAKLAAKTGRATVAKTVLLSDEALADMVDHLFGQYLDRDATDAEVTKYRKVLKTKNLASVEASILGSVEYQSRINTDFAQALYLDVLGRTATAPELITAYKTSGLKALATKVTGLKEYRLDYAADLYSHLLHRPATPDETTALAKKAGPLLNLKLLVLSGDEYFNHG